MEFPFERPKILTLSGITLPGADRDLRDRILSGGLFGLEPDDINHIDSELQETGMRNFMPTGYGVTQISGNSELGKWGKIPNIFNGLNSWPRVTNILCWNCNFQFETRPVFIPTTISCGMNTGIMISTYGNMCSFGCAKKFLNESRNCTQITNTWQAHDNLNTLYFIYTGYWVAEICEAPSKYELRQYGGELTDIEFLKKIKIVAAAQEQKHASIGRKIIPGVPEADRINSLLQLTTRQVPTHRHAPDSAWGLQVDNMPNIEITYMEDKHKTLELPFESFCEILPTVITEVAPKSRARKSATLKDSKAIKVPKEKKTRTPKEKSQKPAKTSKTANSKQGPMTDLSIDGRFDS